MLSSATAARPRRSEVTLVDAGPGEGPTAQQGGNIFVIATAVGAAVGGLAGPIGAGIGAAVGASIGLVGSVVNVLVQRASRHGAARQHVRLQLNRIERGEETELTAHTIDQETFEGIIAQLSRTPLVKINFGELERARTFLWNTKFTEADLTRLATRMDTSRLQSLSLRSIGLNTATALEFLTAVRHAPQLRSLNVSQNQLAHTGFHFLKLLMSHQHLAELNMSRCSLSLEHVSRRGEQLLLEDVQDAIVPTHPVTLDLSDNAFPGDAYTLTEFGHAHRALFERVQSVKLERTSCPVSTMSMMRFFVHSREINLSGLRYNSTQLASMISAWNRPTFQGRVIDLSSAKNLSDDFFTELYALFPNARDLRRLYLQNASVSIASVDTLRVFGRALAEHSSLDYLNVKGCFSGKALRALNEGILEGAQDGMAEIDKASSALTANHPGGRGAFTVYADWSMLPSESAQESSCSIM